MMITLMVNYYAEDPGPAIRSARAHLGELVDRVVALDGRYDGFAELAHASSDLFSSDLFQSEHAKRNHMLELAGEPDPMRWLFWLDCDERVVYASPMLGEQLRRLADPGARALTRGRPYDVAGVRFIEPLYPDAPGLEDPRRGVRDNVIEGFPRLIRHQPGLRYRYRHDFLVDAAGAVLLGWPNENPVQPVAVDLIVVHRRTQTPERVAAKAAFYQGSIRQAESRSPTPMTE